MNTDPRDLGKLHRNKLSDADIKAILKPVDSKREYNTLSILRRGGIILSGRIDFLGCVIRNQKVGHTARAVLPLPMRLLRMTH